MVMTYGDNEIDCLFNKLASFYERQYNATMIKQSNWLTTLLKGMAANAATGVGGSWGAAGLMRTAGRLLGAKSYQVAQKGYDTATRTALGDKLKGSGKLITADNVSDVLKNENEILENIAAESKKYFNKGSDAWELKDRYYKPGTIESAPGSGLFSGIGQRLAYWGDKLDDKVSDVENWYRKDLRKSFSDPNTNFARGLTRFGTMAIPTGYLIASELDTNKSPWSAPGRFTSSLFQYGSIPGLISSGVTYGGEKLTNAIQDATVEGARFGAEATAAELANAGRAAHIMGLISPSKLSREISGRANQQIDAISEQLKNIRQQQI